MLQDLEIKIITNKNNITVLDNNRIKFTYGDEVWIIKRSKIVRDGKRVYFPITYYKTDQV